MSKALKMHGQASKYCRVFQRFIENEERWLFLKSLLTTFEVSSIFCVISKNCLEPKSNRQIKLSLSQSLIYTDILIYKGFGQA